MCLPLCCVQLELAGAEPQVDGALSRIVLLCCVILLCDIVVFMAV